LSSTYRIVGMAGPSSVERWAARLRHATRV
jgi:hypothetical protein